MGGSSRRIFQLLWLAAGLLFTFAFLRSIGTPDQAKEWASSRVSGLVSTYGGRIPMREFMVNAEAVWAKTVKQRHDMIAADYGDASKMPLFPIDYAKHPYSIWDFTPASFSCPHEMERIGRMGDGGKWVCGMSRYVNFPTNRECIIYSFGVHDESSFENEMLSRTKCRVWAYDFSVVDFGEQLEPGNRDRAKFLQAGIAGKTNTTKTPPFYSISDLMDMNGHEYIDILKMDIESAEFEATEALHNDFPITAGELPIGQLMIEIHLNNELTAFDYLDWWARLESRGLRATWTEPNLLAVTLKLKKENPLLAEYTMINVHDSKNVLYDGKRL
ncbi:methyltransferase domain-containing protein [Colletotrichum cereale]|nr:methyltransferase domain-containing protein [Colletotrichum cereale]